MKIRDYTASHNSITLTSVKDYTTNPVHRNRLQILKINVTRASFSIPSDYAKFLGLNRGFSNELTAKDRALGSFALVFNGPEKAWHKNKADAPLLHTTVLKS